NAPLGLYMMTSWGTASAPSGRWFGEPSYLGFWVAQNPWGPWTQIHEETAWMPGNDAAARAFAPQIAPKWIAPDGKSFWLVWSDFQGEAARNDELRRRREELKGRSKADLAGATLDIFRRFQPYYAFNAQRVDVVFQ